MPHSLELLKIVAYAVIIERDANGRIVGEHRTHDESLFTPEEIGGYYDKSRAEVDRGNLLLVENGAAVNGEIVERDPATASADT